MLLTSFALKVRVKQLRGQVSVHMVPQTTGRYDLGSDDRDRPIIGVRPFPLDSNTDIPTGVTDEVAVAIRC